MKQKKRKCEDVFLDTTFTTIYITTQYAVNNWKLLTWNKQQNIRIPNCTHIFCEWTKIWYIKES